MASQQSPAAHPAYPQLNNLYPAPTAAAASSSTPTPPPAGPSDGPRPAGGPGSGFPLRPPQPPLQPFAPGAAAYNAHGYGMNGAGGGMGMGMGPGMGKAGNGGDGEKNVAEMIVDSGNKYMRAFQTLLDRSTPLTVQRWAFTGFLLIVFVLVIVIRQGWYIICYALAIYLLNLFLAFLQPKFDPSIQQDLAADDVEEGAPGLPGGGSSSRGGLSGLMSGFRPGDDEEFRPFIRRLPEFKFWLSATKATLVALACTLTRATDVPVYWPILLVYFFVLFGLTMRRQIQHMIKYRYIPFDLGRKATYRGKK